MVFPSNQNDVPPGHGSSGPFQSPAGPFAPLPPSRRQHDTGVQWVVVFATVIVMIVVVAVLLAVGPSRSVTPAPRAPSTYSQQDCGYTYLSCPTTGRPR